MLCWGQTPETPMKTLLALAAALAIAAPAIAADSLADVAWIAGQWRATQGDGAVVTETWLPAEGGVMPGISRTLEGGKARVEYMRIDEKGGQIAFTAIVGRQPPTTFVAKSRTADEVVFENPAHDFPQRIIYRRCGQQLCAAIEGTMNGKLERIEWTYDRVR
jgi:hypothetical protein